MEEETEAIIISTSQAGPHGKKPQRCHKKMKTKNKEPKAMERDKNIDPIFYFI